MLVVLLGPPGVGKGTVAGPLAEALEIPKLATGDVLRAARRAGTPRGLEAQAYMDRGDLVPDDVILGIIKEALETPETANGAILDGAVRTVPQAQGLERALGELRRKLDSVVLFDAPDDELVRRLSGRTVCESCQTPYTGREPGSKCEKCGGNLVRRADDEPDAVRNRLQVYRAQTEPVIAWYEGNGVRMCRIDAVGTPAEVLSRVKTCLAK
jgi:adenylate kinase